MLNNTSPEQLNHIFNMLKKDNNNIDPQRSVNMAVSSHHVLSSEVQHILLDPNDTQLSDNAAYVTSQDPELSVQTPTVVTRRSSRSAKPPIWHTYYVLTKKNTTAGSCSYSISDVVDYQSISPTYKNFVT
ncbi:hypothetical protein H5410_028779, partial [Solanum commersonii]